ncbi:trypsin-like serine protease [Stella sp.]|uniref:trypsin-like serine protease n=1 Tax=Stella sp. TaxID=2912054 RepID=UPI0035AF002E
MIFGADDRTEVTQTTVLPWSAVVRLEIDFPFGGAVATGVLIGPNDLLTVGHAVYSADLGGYAMSIRAIPGASGSSEPFGAARSIALQVDPRWVENDGVDGPVDAFSFDYAVVTLDHAIGAAAGTLPVATLADPVGVAATSAGYPADRGYLFPYATAGTVDSADIDTLFFEDDLDLSAGQSGSPVMVGGAVVGLISFDYELPPYANGVLRITDEYLETIARWAATNDATAGADWIEGGPAGDLWIGHEGADTIFGFGGADTIDGDSGDDDLNGNQGADLVRGGPGSDLVRGGQGDDTVLGGSAGDWHVNGNRGRDLVQGGSGDDRVFGGTDADTLLGEAGADTLSGDLGDDVLTGGDGADRFLYRSGGGIDRILDFVPGTDRIVLERDPDGTLNGVSLPTADAVPALLATGGGATVLSLGAGRIELAGVGPADLAPADFLVL